MSVTEKVLKIRQFKFIDDSRLLVGSLAGIGARPAFSALSHTEIFKDYGDIFCLRRMDRLLKKGISLAMLNSKLLSQKGMDKELPLTRSGSLTIG